MTFEESFRQDMRMKNDHELNQIDQRGTTQDPGLAASLNDPDFHDMVRDAAKDELARREERRMAIAEDERQFNNGLGEDLLSNDSLSSDPLSNDSLTNDSLDGDWSVSNLDYDLSEDETDSSEKSSRKDLDSVDPNDLDIDEAFQILERKGYPRKILEEVLELELERAGDNSGDVVWQCPSCGHYVRLSPRPWGYENPFGARERQCGCTNK